MQNIVPSAEAIRVLQILGRHKIAASWVGGKVEFRSAAKPTAHLVALLDSHESAIVELMRPNGDGQSFLDLARDRHRPLLEATERQRPPDVADGPWRTAIDGLWAFLAGGYGDEAERLGWPRNEIYAVPALWARVDLCGAALMIGDSAVVAITSAEIRIKTVGRSQISASSIPSASSFSDGTSTRLRRERAPTNMRSALIARTAPATSRKPSGRCGPPS
jgi:hypothetical protein